MIIRNKFRIAATVFTTVLLVAGAVDVALKLAGVTDSVSPLADLVSGAFNVGVGAIIALNLVRRSDLAGGA